MSPRLADAVNGTEVAVCDGTVFNGTVFDGTVFNGIVEHDVAASTAHHEVLAFIVLAQESVPQAAPILLGILLGVVFLVSGLLTRELVSRSDGQQRHPSSAAQTPTKGEKAAVRWTRRAAWIAIVGGVTCLALAALAGLSRTSGAGATAAIAVTAVVTTLGLSIAAITALVVGRP